MRKYEDFLPGSADRIISMAERQSAHRQSMESKVVSSGCANERIGMIFGFIICLAAIFSGLYLILHGKNSSGIAAILVALASPAGVFIYGKSQQKKDLQARQRGIIQAARNTQAQ